jgi:predicted amidohydrolase
MEHITIAAVQPHLRAGGTNPVSSAQHVINLMKKASETEDVDLFVLPELCPLGYSDDTFDMLADQCIASKVIEEIDHLMSDCAKVSVLDTIYCVTIGN